MQQKHAVIDAPVVRAHIRVHHEQLAAEVVPVPAPGLVPIHQLWEDGTRGAQDGEAVLAAAGCHDEVI